MGERVGAGDDRLRPERLGGPGVGHLARHHAPEVLLEADDVDDAHRLAAGHPQRAAEGAIAEDERGRARREDERAGKGLGGSDELQLQAGAESSFAGRQLVRLAGGVPHRERRGRGDDDALGARHEQHVVPLDRRLAEVGPGVVVGDDVVRRPAVERVAVGAVLRQPDAVPPAVARDEEGRACRRASCVAAGPERPRAARRAAANVLTITKGRPKARRSWPDATAGHPEGSAR